MSDVTTVKEIEERVAKFRHRAKRIKDDLHLAIVLRGFPASERQRIYDEVKDVLGFTPEAFPAAHLITLDLRANALKAAIGIKIVKPKKAKNV